MNLTSLKTFFVDHNPSSDRMDSNLADFEFGNGLGARNSIP